MQDNQTSLTYRSSEGGYNTVENCEMTIDKAGRFWLWSEDLQHNLAYKSASREDCLLAAINSLLFTIKLKDERINKLQRVNDLTEQFLETVFPPDED